MPDKPKPYSEWETPALEAEAERLAKWRTSVREAQNAVAAELDIRKAMDDMSPETRRVLQVRLGGGLTPAGETEAVQ